MARIDGRPVTLGELREFVIKRDARCILAKIGFPGHVCYAKWGGVTRKAEKDYDYSLEHVTTVHSHLEGRVDDDAHCVGLCYQTNVKPPSHAEREAMREELRRMHPECTNRTS